MRAISDLCLRIFSVMDLLVHSLKASAQKSELHPQSFRARWQANESELSRPASELAGRRQTSVSAVEPPFPDRAFQLCVARLKPIRRRHALARAAREKCALRTPRMRRNQKDFFHPLNRRAEAAPQKINLNKVCHSVNLCPISPISPISPRNAPAAPFECSSW